MGLTLPKEFGYVALTSAGIVLQCLASAYSVLKLRKQFDVPYPDTGSGRHSSKLTDYEWEHFNNAQRIHHNYVEQHSCTQALLLLAGVFHPIGATISGVSYIISRFIYQYAYLNHGPKARIYGVVPIDISLTAMLFLVIQGSLKLLQWI